jgi:hypothetical protein
MLASKRHEKCSLPIEAKSKIPALMRAGAMCMASPDTPPGAIRFGQFAIDVTNRELRKGGSLVKPQPQQFAVEKYPDHGRRTSLLRVTDEHWCMRGLNLKTPQSRWRRTCSDLQHKARNLLHGSLVAEMRRARQLAGFRAIARLGILGNWAASEAGLYFLDISSMTTLCLPPPLSSTTSKLAN